ncbi:MAG: PEP-CTERM sorting domain-containing protein, partial [Bryobacteraceae bacterium]
SSEKLLFPALVLAMVGLAAPAWANTVLYSTSFESPTFTTGPLAGQDGWSGFGPSGASVESFFADTGSQAVFLDGGAASQSGPYYATTSTGPLVDLSADLAIFTSSTQTEWQFSALAPSLGGFLGGINILADNSIEAQTAGNPIIGTFARATGFNSSAWVNVNLLFDLATQTYDISVGGVLLDSNVPICGSSSGCTGATLSTFGDGLFDTFGGGNDSGYMDNYSVTLVTATPEPGNLGLIALGLVGIGLVRRKMQQRSRAVA